MYFYPGDNISRPNSFQHDSKVFNSLTNIVFEQLLPHQFEFIFVDLFKNVTGVMDTPSCLVPFYAKSKHSIFFLVSKPPTEFLSISSSFHSVVETKTMFRFGEKFIVCDTYNQLNGQCIQNDTTHKTPLQTK